MLESRLDRTACAALSSIVIHSEAWAIVMRSLGSLPRLPSRRMATAPELAPLAAARPDEIPAPSPPASPPPRPLSGPARRAASSAGRSVASGPTSVTPYIKLTACQNGPREFPLRGLDPIPWHRLRFQLAFVRCALSFLIPQTMSGFREWGAFAPTIVRPTFIRPGPAG